MGRPNTSRPRKTVRKAVRIESKFASRAQGLPGAEPPEDVREYRESRRAERASGRDREASPGDDEAIFEEKKPEIEAIKDAQEREIRETQVWLMAEEIALNDLVLTL